MSVVEVAGIEVIYYLDGSVPYTCPCGHTYQIQAHIKIWSIGGSLVSCMVCGRPVWCLK
jgi:hypothetical protein